MLLVATAVAVECKAPRKNGVAIGSWRGSAGGFSVMSVGWR
jgi:hypothetical protein